MDPLSISASIAGLITLTELIVSQGYEVLKGIKHAKAEINELLAEITALFGVLQSLRLVADRFQGQEYESVLQANYLRSCHDLVSRVRDRLKQSLPADHDGRWRAAGKSLKWPFSSHETKTLIADVEKHKATLSLALNVDGISAIIDTLQGQNDLLINQQSMHTDLAQLREDTEQRRIRDDLKETMSERRRMLSEWSTLKPEVQQVAASHLRHPGTGKWFLNGDLFKSFLEGEVGSLWLSGYAGVGKTVLVSTCVEILESSTLVNPGEGLAFFYCDYRNVDTQSAPLILRSLIKHAATQSEDTLADLLEFIKKQDASGSLSNYASLSDLQNLFLKITGHFDTFYVVIDALDECTERTRFEVLAMLNGLQCNNSTVLRLLFTSREDPDIADALAGFQKLEVTADSNDIEMFVAAEIERRIQDGRLRIDHPEVKDRIIDKLSHSADGMFRWVACQIDALCELGTDRARLKALEKLPNDLFSTYERVLTRIHSQGTDAQNVVRRSLQWILGSIAPITIPQLIEAIAVEDSDAHLDNYAKVSEKDIFRWCSCLVRPSVGQGSLELAHFTVEEFLEILEHSKNPSFEFLANLRQDIQVTLARTCLKFLLFEDFAQADILTYPWQDSHPFWPYTATFWAEHYRQSRPDEDTRGLIQKFFSPSVSDNFITWNRFRGFKTIMPTLVSHVAESHEEAARQAVEAADSISPLHRAAESSLSDVTKWLLANGSDPNKASSIGFPLEVAISRTPVETQEESLEIIVSLLQPYRHVNINIAKDPSVTPLALAIGRESSAIVKLLLEAGATIDLRSLFALEETMKRRYSSKRIFSDFMNIVGELNISLSAHIREQLAMLHLYIGSTTKHGQDLVVQSHTASPNVMKSLQLAVHEAARKDLKEAIERMLPLVTSIDTHRDKEGRSALHVAVMNSHLDTVSQLLAYGANPNLLDNFGNTTGHLCTRINPDVRILGALVEHGLNINAQDYNGQTCLHLAAASNCTPIIQFCLDIDHKGTLRTTQDRDGNVPLACAIAGPELLLPETFDSFARHMTHQEFCAANRAGETFLHIAIRHEQHFAIQSLLDQSLLDRKTIDGSSPLHYAIKYHLDPSLFQMLLDAGANPCQTTHLGETPLHLACSGNSQLLPMLMAHASVPDFVNIDDVAGNCPIHVIAMSSSRPRETNKLLQQLLSSRCTDVDRKNNARVTALFILAVSTLTPRWDEVEPSWTYPDARRDFEDVLDAMQIMIEHGADPNTSDRSRRTALHHLCQGGSKTKATLKAATLLIDRGCDTLLHDNTGKKALEYLLQDLEAGVPTDKLSDPDLECQMIGRLFEKVDERQLGAPRPLVTLLQHKANEALLLQVAKKTLEPQKSYDDNDSTLSPLEASCKYSCPFEVFRTLVAHCCDPTQVIMKGRPLLMLACGSENIDFIGLVLSLHPDLEAKNKDGLTAIHIAVGLDRQNMIRELLEAGADSTQHDNEGLNVWHKAALSDSVRIWDVLCQYPADKHLEVRTRQGYTPLLCAAYVGDSTKIQYLLEKGADMRAKNMEGHTLLHIICSKGHTQVLSEIVGRSTPDELNDCAEDGETPLLLAANKGHGGIVDMLLNAGVRYDCTDRHGQTFLHHLIKRGLSTQVRDLIVNRSVTRILEFRDQLGRTPLLLAAEEGQEDVVGALIQSGASYEAIAKDGWDLLTHAASTNASGVIDILFERQCIRNIDKPIPNSGRTALSIAASRGHLAAVNVLLKHGAKPARTDDQGWNILHHAANRSRTKVLERLVGEKHRSEYVTNVDTRNNMGETALMIVKKRIHEDQEAAECLNILEKAGAERSDTYQRTGSVATTWGEMGGGICTAG